MSYRHSEGQETQSKKKSSDVDEPNAFNPEVKDFICRCKNHLDVENCTLPCPSHLDDGWPNKSNTEAEMRLDQKESVEKAATKYAIQYKTKASSEGLENIADDFKAGAQWQSSQLQSQISQFEADKKKWKERCEAAEDYISKSPCDPDIYPEQSIAYEKWQSLIQKHTKKRSQAGSECFYCGKFVMGEFPEYCCSGINAGEICGCHGKPTNVITCSKGCFDALTQIPLLKSEIALLKSGRNL
jgi:hypothetical protein